MSQNIPVTEAQGSAAPGSAATAGHPRRWWILGALVLSLMVIGLDLTVLSVALPVLVTGLKAADYAEALAVRETALSRRLLFVPGVIGNGA